MILLDTDHFNVLQIGKGTSYETLAAYMDASPDQHFATTVVTFEEHMRGWLAVFLAGNALYGPAFGKAAARGAACGRETIDFLVTSSRSG